jgi:hypothetical protein
VDDETLHYARVYKAKRARLNILEEQIAAIGEFNVSPHVAMERDSLTEELGMFEVAMGSPARAEAGEELGVRGRFVVGYQQNQDIKKSMAALKVQIETLAKTVETGFAMHRTWILLIGVVVILIFAIVVALGTAMYIGGLPK